eukprot:984570_1
MIGCRKTKYFDQNNPCLGHSMTNIRSILMHLLYIKLKVEVYPLLIAISSAKMTGSVRDLYLVQKGRTLDDVKCTDNGDLNWIHTSPLAILNWRVIHMTAINST